MWYTKSQADCKPTGDSCGAIAVQKSPWCFAQFLISFVIAIIALALIPPPRMSHCPFPLLKYENWRVVWKGKPIAVKTCMGVLPASDHLPFSQSSNSANSRSFSSAFFGFCSNELPCYVATHYQSKSATVQKTPEGPTSTVVQIIRFTEHFPIHTHSIYISYEDN